MQLNAIIEKDESGYFAYVPELKGYYSQEDSFEDAVVNISEAAELYLGTLDDEKKSPSNISYIIVPILIQSLKTKK